MKQYTITSVDIENQLVYVSYIYNTHALDDRVVVADPKNPDIITATVIASFKNFVIAMDALDGLILPASVTSLIGKPQPQS